MRRLLIAANWKMNGTKASAHDLLSAMVNAEKTFERNDVTIMPPFVFLAEAHKLLTNSTIHLGAQTVAAEKNGAFTGEISAEMLREFACDYVIIGHSERRAYYGETDAIVANKVLAAVAYDLRPIICVGESLTERHDNLTKKIIEKQLNAILTLDSAHDLLQNACFAYEPIWAIGTGVSATPEQAQEVHSFIRTIIAEFDAELAKKIRIIYGGSVKASNAQALLNMPDIDGALVGGASLIAEEFLEICQCNKLY